MHEDPVHQLNRRIEIERRMLFNACKRTFNFVRMSGNGKPLKVEDWDSYVGPVVFMFEDLDGEIATSIFNKRVDR